MLLPASFKKRILFCSFAFIYMTFSSACCLIPNSSFSVSLPLYYLKQKKRDFFLFAFIAYFSCYVFRFYSNMFYLKKMFSLSPLYLNDTDADLSAIQGRMCFKKKNKLFFFCACLLGTSLTHKYSVSWINSRFLYATINSWNGFMHCMGLK